MSHPRYILEIPRETPSLNKIVRQHWTRVRAIRKLWDLEVLAARPDQVEPLERCRIHITRICARRVLDHDNLVGGCKVVLDALVNNRLIVDDNTQVIESLEVIQEKPQTKGSRATIIRIYSVT